MANPLCEFCLADGRFSQADVVDHVEPHRGNATLFFTGKLQSLCKQHHDSTKQREEKSGVVTGGDVNGDPLNENHHWNK